MWRLECKVLLSNRSQVLLATICLYRSITRPKKSLAPSTCCQRVCGSPMCLAAIHFNCKIPCTHRRLCSRHYIEARLLCNHAQFPGNYISLLQCDLQSRHHSLPVPDMRVGRVKRRPGVGEPRSRRECVQCSAAGGCNEACDAQRRLTRQRCAAGRLVHGRCSCSRKME